MRVSPHEAIYFKFNMKSPGLSHSVTTTELDLSYNHRYEDVYRPLAYTRLILSGVRGEQESFVRDDELIRAWEIFSPLLEKIEDGKKDTGPWTLMTFLETFSKSSRVFFLQRRNDLLLTLHVASMSSEGPQAPTKEVLKYPFGSRGPAAADESLAQFNFLWNKSYAWKPK